MLIRFYQRRQKNKEKKKNKNHTEFAHIQFFFFFCFATGFLLSFSFVLRICRLNSIQFRKKSDFVVFFLYKLFGITILANRCGIRLFTKHLLSIFVDTSHESLCVHKNRYISFEEIEIINYNFLWYIFL